MSGIAINIFIKVIIIFEKYVFLIAINKPINIPNINSINNKQSATNAETIKYCRVNNSISRPCESVPKKILL